MDEDLLDSEHSSVGSDPGVSLAEFDLTSQEKSGNEYEMLNADQLIGLMYEIIRSVSSIIHLPDTILRLLLAHFSWDKDALTEAYFEQGEKCLFDKAKISPININSSTTPSDRQVASLISKMSCSSDSRTKSEESCEICCTVVDNQDQMGLGCGHYFCLACWKNYLKWKLIQDSQIDRILCPAFNCEFVVHDSIVFQLIAQDEFMKRRFQKLTTNSFVQHSRSLTWCPGADCVYAARYLQGSVYEPRLVECESCDEAFCFSCGSPWHEPAQCNEIMRWMGKIAQDAGTGNWLVANTKECPKCRVVIEKAGGCNHMICYNQHCKHEFCWVCLGKWEPHGSEWYSCNRYDKEDAQKTRDKLNESRAELHRYLFYFNRYSNHLQSLKFENRLHASVAQKMRAMQVDGVSYIDVKFITNVVDVLCKCRRTLMYTYVFAYFVKRSNQSIIFEGNQSDLERATEHLSALLERDLNTTSVTEIKQKLQDKATYCENRRNVLLNHVAEGNDAGTWEYLSS